MGRNYKRNPRPENIEPKTSADVQSIRKTPQPTVKKQFAKQGNIKPNLERKTTYTKNHRQPTLSPTTHPILPQQGRDTGASRTKS